MDYNQLALFVAVVEAGSLSEAARRLQVAKSNLSRALTRLEKSVGTQLIYRNTRSFKPTEAGAQLFQLCRDPLFQLKTAQDRIQLDQKEVRGKLIITAAVDLAHTVLPPLISEFMKAYPLVDLEVRGEDRTVDLVKEGVDLALRIGSLQDSSLKALKIGDINLIFVSTPQYLGQQSKIRNLENLKEHRLLLFNLRQEKLQLFNKRTQQKTKMKIQSWLHMNNPLIVKSVVLQGQGVALLPDFACYDELKTGRLIRVLPDWNSDISPFHFVWPSHIAQSPKVKAFIQLTQPKLKAYFTQS